MASAECSTKSEFEIPGVLVKNVRRQKFWLKEPYEEIRCCCTYRGGTGGCGSRSGAGRRTGPGRQTEHLCASRDAIRFDCDLVNGIVTAFNNRDTAYLQKVIA